MSNVVIYVSSHGLGHAVRDATLIAALAARTRRLRFIVRTAAEPWAFRPPMGASLEVQPAETDTGVSQIDSLRPDEDDTARRAAAFYAEFDRRTLEEAAVLGRLDAALVIGDIPPLAFAAAARAGVPSVAVGNFTWDWIYRGYPAFDRAAPGVVDTIRHAYGHATHALRLPLHGGFDAMRAAVEDIPFIARQSQRGRIEARRVLGLSAEVPVVLASFGGYGVDLPYEALAASGAFALLTIDRGLALGLGHEDLVAAADVVVSKPGYGIVSECVANGAALLYTSRGRFVEYDVFVAGMPRILRCRHLSQEDLRAGRWTAGVDALLGQPPAPERPALNGAAIAAEKILDWIEREPNSERLS
jgi:L-arabinokinase